MMRQTITGFIAEAIQVRLDSPDSPLWCDQIAIKDDPPIPGGGHEQGVNGGDQI